ncbi:hypothetical protein Mapa_011948 [Marchantia paleacea]|nr:hypothetical protein Mapa_011948 [Marchantia paleacea]
MSSCVMSASRVSCGLPVLGSSKTLGQQISALGLPKISFRRSFPSSAGILVRAAKKDVPLPDTKVEMSEEAVKQNEKEEPLRVFDNTAAGKFARPESERRPELGNTNFSSVMKFDGPAPETINGRLAMLGMSWAVAAELMTGQSVAQQVVDGTGALWFLAVAPVIIWASFVPIFGWNESPDSRKFGPFNAKAERWNGRAAMIGFVSLLLTENLLIHGPLFGFV